MNELVDEISKLEQRIWNSKNREAIVKWHDYSEDLLYDRNYWENVDQYDLERAIEYASFLINKFNLKERKMKDIIEITEDIEINEIKLKKGDKVKVIKESAEDYDIEEFMSIDEGDYRSESKQMKKRGQEDAVTISNIIFELTKTIIKNKAQKMHLDLQSIADQYNISVDDLIMDTDMFFQTSLDLLDIYTQAFQNNW